jgi:hypothetical protein
MSRKNYPTDIIEQTRAILEAWKNINPAFMVGDLTLAEIEADLARTSPLLVQIDSLETQLVDLRNQRDTLFLSLWDNIKRVRAAVKGVYGDDSSQYEMIGGTRLSDRKHPTRKEGAA